MNTKGTLLLLVVALAVLGAIYYQNQKEEQTYTAAAIPVQTIPGVTSSTIERIIVDAPDQAAVTLTKSGNQWYTNVERKNEADPSAIIAVTTVLEEPVTANVVSSNPDSYAEYEVTDTSSTKVQIFEKGSAKPAVDLLIGKNGPTAFTTYIRIAGTKDVLNAQANLAMTFKRDNGWRERQIFDFSGANTTRIEESGTSATFIVTKTADDKWMFEAPESGEADFARITSLANMLSSLQAERFIETDQIQNLANWGLEPPRQTIALSYEDKTTSPSKLTSVTLLIGNDAPGGAWHAKRADKEDIFTIGSHAADALTPTTESIKVPSPPPVTEATETINTEQATTVTDMPTTTIEAMETTGSAPMTTSTTGTTTTL